MNGSNVVLSIVGILIAIGLFLLLREVFCWYNKINERLKLQQETNELLRKILDHQVSNAKVLEEKTEVAVKPEVNQ